MTPGYQTVMKSCTLIHILVLTISGSVLSAQAPSAGGNPPPTRSAADLAWLDLQAAANDGELSKRLPDKVAEKREALDRLAARFTAAADKAKDFYSKHPEHAKAAEARAIEVTSLIAAVQSGNPAVEGRLRETIDNLRKDKSVPAPQRARAAASYEFSTKMRTARTKEARLAMVEQVSRGLMSEFPTEPQGYESLLTLAHMSPEAKARELAGELSGPGAPAAVRTGAADLVAKLDLVGKALVEELAGANAAASAGKLTKGRPTILYTWATWSQGSLTFAAELKKRNLPANLIAINLDTDSTAAALVAGQNGLPGELLYDDRGRSGALAQRLKLFSAPEVYLVDAQGFIRDVRGMDQFDQKLKSVGL